MEKREERRWKKRGKSEKNSSGGVFITPPIRSGRHESVAAATGAVATKCHLAWRVGPPRWIYRPLRYVAADIFFLEWGCLDYFLENVIDSIFYCLVPYVAEFFLRQFCDAHTCTGKQKPFPRGAKKETSVFFLAISILILMLLPIFYVLVYLYRREMKKGVQDLKRISQTGRKSKPS
eukprot:TRINITY_DN9693_c0_g1_i2.p1 TRINITY_DN9693_c0_g1~~TRINITY_DN9693_c0_g1_i2.p1  ORF type:complete len:177 (-),score=11.64 TRINITY_DN9693_c0_g1_i2:1425-1955(-)